MKREKLIRSKEYILAQMQLGLLNLIGDYKDKNKLKDYQLANELGVSKGYVSQLLNATFDHKLSKVVDLAVSFNKMPLLYFVDLDQFVQNDSEDKVYEIYPVIRPRQMPSGDLGDNMSTLNSRIGNIEFSNASVESITKGNEISHVYSKVSHLKPSYS